MLDAIDDGVTLSLDRMVPTTDEPMRFFWVSTSLSEETREQIHVHPSVHSFDQVETTDSRALYRIDWAEEHDHLLQAIRAHDAQLLKGMRVVEGWRLNLRFPSHKRLSLFREDCQAARIQTEAIRVSSETRPETDRPYGLTPQQREAITLAVTEGYYDIPRECKISDLAEQLEISDQAVTERLRRGISALVSNTFLTDEWSDLNNGYDGSLSP